MLKFVDEEESQNEEWFKERVSEAAATYGVFPFTILGHQSMFYHPEDPNEPLLHVDEPNIALIWTFAPQWKMPYCVVDIGANVGAFTYLASMFATDVRAYEPCSSTFQRLQSNIKKHTLDESTTFQFHQLAAGSTSGETVYMNASESQRSGDSFSTKEKPEGETEQVNTICLEDIIADTPMKRIDYLKIDCEGAEYDFLMDKDLSSVGYLEIELHGDDEELKQRLATHMEKTHQVIATYTDGHDSGVEPMGYLKGINLKIQNSVHTCYISGMLSHRRPELAVSNGEFTHLTKWGEIPERDMFVYKTTKPLKNVTLTNVSGE
jgi:FkbM family methyltransferase